MYTAPRLPIGLTAAPQLVQEGALAAAHCLFSVVTAGRRGIPSGTALIAMPGWPLPPETISGVRGQGLWVDADWMMGILRPFWGETGLLRALLAGHLFSLDVFSSGLAFPLQDAESRRALAEMAVLDDAPAGPGAVLAHATGTVLRVVAALAEGYARAYPRTHFPLDATVWQAASIIETAVELGAPVTVASVAVDVGVPQAKFARQFQAATGYAPRDYIQQRRIYRGARMLAEGNGTVTEIAQRLGFSDSAHFCRIFKRERGVPPNQYRQAARAGTNRGHEAGG